MMKPLNKITIALLSLSSVLTSNFVFANVPESDLFKRDPIDIPRLSSLPEIDGVLSEGEWSDAKKITDFVEFRPTIGEKPDHPIEAYVSFDEKYFYVAATIHQPSESVVDRVLTQGSWIWREDYFGLILDTNFDKSDAYLFHVTPSGVKLDGIANGAQWIGEWSTLWYAKTSKSEESWSVEIAIPMKSISFDPNKPSWGLQLRHKKSKPNQQYYWNLNNIQDNPWNANQVAEIKGITNVTQGKGIEARTSLSVKDNQGDFDVEPSLDLFYKFTPNLTGVVTLNTDFTGTGVDSQVVNMTRFNSYFVERRDFFLQDIQMFQFGGLGNLDNNGLGFYSRRIGLAPDGEVLDIDWGTKLTGQIANTQLGMLSVRQQAAKVDGVNLEEHTQLTVARVKQLLTENHSIGALITDGSPSGEDSRTWGFDYQYQDIVLEDQSIRFDAWYQDVEKSDQQLEDTHAYGVKMQLPNDKVSFTGIYRYLGENYNPALGFVRRNGISLQDYYGAYRERPNQGMLANYLNYYQFFAGYREINNVHGELESREIQFRPLDLETKQQDLIRLTLKQRTEVLQSPWQFSDNIEFAAGEHLFEQTQLFLSTGTQRNIYATLSVTDGQYYSADLTDFYANLHYQPNKHLYVNLGRGVYYYQQGAENYNVHRTHLRVNYAFNADWSWNNHVQHNTRSNQFSLFTRLRYQPAPDVLYQLSVNKGYDLEQGWHERETTHDETAVKINYQFSW